jgi:hypothetical protein
MGGTSSPGRRILVRLTRSFVSTRVIMTNRGAVDEIASLHAFRAGAGSEQASTVKFTAECTHRRDGGCLICYLRARS